jgi:site-specific recombinase XerD
MNNNTFTTRFLAKLYNKVPDEYLSIIEKNLISLLNDYDMVKKTTEIRNITPDIDNELKEYLITRKIENLSDNTLNQYKHSLYKFIHVVNKQVSEITTSDIKLYLYKLESSSDIKKISVNNTRIIISAFFTWLYDNEYIAKNPCKNISPIKYDKNTRHPLTLDEMERLRLSCETYREKAVLEFLYSTGCRCSEMVNIRLSDIDFNNRTVSVIGKGRKHRVVYLSPRCAAILDEYFKSNEKKDSEYLFTSMISPYNKLTTRSIEYMIKNLGKKANIERTVTPHIIRHTTATVAIDKGMPIEQVQKMLGHESINTTLIYAEVNDTNVKHNHEKYIM